jgi:hypothetical protein
LGRGYGLCFWIKGMLRNIAMNATTQVLLENGYRSADEVFWGWALMTAMSKLEQYRAECEALAKKHGQTLVEFESAAHSVKGREDFGAEDDLADWEFAAHALTWWQAKIEELRVAPSS